MAHLLAAPGATRLRNARIKRMVRETSGDSEYKNGRSTWDQLCIDAKTRRQIPFTALIIGLVGDDGLYQVVMSSGILTDDETEATQAEGIVAKVRPSGILLFILCMALGCSFK